MKKLTDTLMAAAKWVAANRTLAYIAIAVSAGIDLMLKYQTPKDVIGVALLFILIERCCTIAVLRQECATSAARIRGFERDMSGADKIIHELEDEVEGFSAAAKIERNRREKLAAYIRQQNPDVDVDALLLKADNALEFEG
jgi:hypothetical protein